MTLTADGRRSLPLLRHGSRSNLTCFYRCGNACDHAVPNTSANPYFGDVAAAVLSRRRLLQAGGASALAIAAGPVLVANPAAAAPTADSDDWTLDATNLTFEAVPPNVTDTITVPESYEWSVVAAWGDPVEIGAAPFDPFTQTAETQSKQFGYNCDYVAVLPLDGNRAILVVNHEYTDEQLMFPAYSGTPTADQKRIAMMAHGMSVVVIERGDGYGEWRLTPTPHALNRRITVSTPMLLTGPAAGHALLQTAADPDGTTVLGTLNNCAGGTTPWGTTLHGEENFNGYFDASGPVDPAYTAAFARYGLLTAAGTTRGWSEVDDRFDLAVNPNEANRHGWIVEIDPSDPLAPPVKHTMLGRFKHEGATVRLADDGRAVVYLGDDERFDYLYKFVSRDPMASGTDKAAQDFNRRLLDYGTLYVARLTGDSPPEEIDGSGMLPSDGEFDGSGVWIRLTSDTQSYVPGMSVAEILINTRLAARPGRTDQDGPARGRRGQPGHGAGLHGVHEQHVPHGRPGGRGEPATDQPARPRGRDPRARQRRRRPSIPVAAGDRGRRPGRPDDVLRRVRQEQGQPDVLPGQRRVRSHRQPVDLHRRQRAGHPRRLVRDAAEGSAARPPQAVHDDADRRRDLRSVDHRRRAERVRRGAAPRRDDRVDVREPVQRVP